MVFHIINVSSMYLSGLSCTAYMLAFNALRVLYVVVLGLFRFCFLFFPPESLPGDDVVYFAGYFHARFFLSALFPLPFPLCPVPCLIALFCFQIVFVPDLFWCNLVSCDHSWIRSGDEQQHAQFCVILVFCFHWCSFLPAI